jgi:hypothetical protein
MSSHMVRRVLPVAKHLYSRPTPPNCNLFRPDYRRWNVAHWHHQCISFADLTGTTVIFFLGSLDSLLFPGTPSSVEAHNEFATEHARYATYVSIPTVHMLPTNSMTHAARRLGSSALSSRHSQCRAGGRPLSSVTRSAWPLRSLTASSLI